MTATSILQLSTLKNVEKVILRASKDLICANLFCEKLGDPCICRLERALARAGSLSNINFLDLSDNKLRSLPPAVFKLSHLQHLNLSNNMLQVISCEELSNLKALLSVDLSGNPLSAESITALIDASKNGNISANVVLPDHVS
jgi:Leucine-rich repeat (LRR) protein